MICAQKFKRKGLANEALDPRKREYRRGDIDLRMTDHVEFDNSREVDLHKVKTSAEDRLRYVKFILVP